MGRTGSDAAAHASVYWRRDVQPALEVVATDMLASTADLHKCRRFYDPQQGTLTLDGVDLRQIDRTFLHQTVALVAQEPLVFAESIEYNITFGVHRPVTQVCLSLIDAAGILPA
jgi:hypothetical protein